MIKNGVEDDSGLLWQGSKGNGGKPNGNNPSTQGILSAYLPGQKDALAQQLNSGFGGGLNQWNGILGQTYSGMTMPPQFNYGGKSHPKKDDDPKNQPDKNTPPLTTGGMPNHAVMQAFQQMAPQQPASMMQPAAQAPNQMMGQAMGQNVLSPQVIAMLRQQFGGR